MEAYFVYVARILHTFASFLNASFLKELFDSWSQDFAIDGLVIYVYNNSLVVRSSTLPTRIFTIFILH